MGGKVRWLIEDVLFITEVFVFVELNEVLLSRPSKSVEPILLWLVVILLVLFITGSVVVLSIPPGEGRKITFQKSNLKYYISIKVQGPNETIMFKKYCLNDK